MYYYVSNYFMEADLNHLRELSGSEERESCWAPPSCVRLLMKCHEAASPSSDVWGMAICHITLSFGTLGTCTRQGRRLCGILNVSPGT